MADEAPDGDDLSDAAHEPRECMPCRGSGQVISNLGGAPGKVTCPWCAGGGVRVPGSDAQAGWPANEQPQPPSVEGPAAPAAPPA